MLPILSKGPFPLQLVSTERPFLKKRTLASIDIKFKLYDIVMDLSVFYRKTCLIKL